MTRRRRSDVHHPMLHVYTLGVDHQDIFYDDDDRQYLLERLGQSVERFGIEIHAYVLMANHFHLQIDRRDGDISAAMQWVLCGHAMRINRTTDRCGPLFTSRFQTVEVENDPQALQLSRYIGLNPLAFLERRDLATYEWASLGAYVGALEPQPWLRTDWILGLNNHTPEKYRSFVFTPQPSDKPDGRQGSPWRAPTCVDIDSAVSIATGSDPEILRAPARGRAQPLRDLAAELAARHRVASLEELARHYGFESLSGLRRATRRARARAARDPAFRRLADQIDSVVRRA